MPAGRTDIAARVVAPPGSAIESFMYVATIIERAAIQPENSLS